MTREIDIRKDIPGAQILVTNDADVLDCIWVLIAPVPTGWSANWHLYSEWIVPGTV